MTRIKFDAEKHKYYIEGQEVPSVSKIIGLNCVPIFLNKWIKKNKADQDANKAHKEKVQAACDWGTNRHQDIEDLLKTRPEEWSHDWVDEQIKILKEKKKESGTIGDVKYKNIINALKFLKEYNIEPQKLEIIIEGEGGAYAGTADIFGKDNDGECISDWKTNDCTAKKFQDYKVPCYEVQNAAYSKPFGIDYGYIVHTHSGFTHKTHNLDKIYHEKFYPLLELYHGRGLHKDSRIVCEMWNQGKDIRDIIMETGIEYVLIRDTINKYSLF